MNLLHMKYALEVARLGSLSKAAESLHTAQPNISRSIKELEGDIGITLFTRTQRGMVLTPEGEEFIGYAHAVIKQMDELDTMYRSGGVRKARFSVACPRAGYLSEAMAALSRSMDPVPMELHYRETGNREILAAVLEGDCDLGIIRYPADTDRYVKTMLEDKGLAYELVAEFTPLVLMSREHPLAGKDSITSADLGPYVELVYADHAASWVPPDKTGKDPASDGMARRMILSDRAGLYDLLTGNPASFMWTSPLSSDVTDRHGLVLRPCTDQQRICKDVLIRRDTHRLTREDNRFITALCEAKRHHFVQ